MFPGEASKGSADFFLDGKFYIVGGYGATFSDCNSEVWQFDPVTYQWTQLEDFLGTARRFTKSFVIGYRAYVCTGTNGTNFNDLWEFNPTAGINEVDEIISVQTFPNPATEYIQFSSEDESVFE